METETYSEHYQTFKMQRFAKRIMTECRSATEIFRAREMGMFVELGHFDKDFL